MDLDAIVEKIEGSFLKLFSVIFLLCSMYILFDAVLYFVYKFNPDKTTNFAGGTMDNPSTPLYQNLFNQLHVKPLFIFCIIVFFIGVMLQIYRKQR